MAYRGARLVHRPTIRNKYLDTFTHTLFSAIHTARHERPDVALFFIAGNSPLTLITRAAGIPTVINVDGLDSDRSKWPGLAKAYLRFAERVRTCQDELRSFLDDLADQGRTVAAYGAAAKGATLLNSTAIGRERIQFVVDRNVHKHGKLMPGCRVPIRPVEALLDERPDDVLLLAWNFADEIVAQQAAYLDGGGTFYVPVPTPRRIAG